VSEAGPITVLVVDDDTIVGQIYTLALERRGFTVVVALDGVAALEAVAARAPDLIFLDIKMPRMDGIEVLRTLGTAGATRSIPVVMLSNFDDPVLILECERLGAKQYCVKANIDPTTLGSIVERWLVRDEA
jgi:two-component system, OmpR family, response regulator